MSAILSSRIVKTTLRLVRTPSASSHCVEPMSLSSPTCVKSGCISNRCSPRLSSWDFKTARASSGPRQEGASFHQRNPRETPRHSASSAKSDANGSGSPSLRAATATRSWSIIAPRVWHDVGVGRRPKRRGGQQAEALSRCDRLDPRVRAQLARRVSQVVANRLGRERQLLRHLRGRQAGRDQFEDLSLAQRQSRLWA